MSSARERLTRVAGDFALILPAAVDDWEGMSERYRERLLEVGAEGAVLLAAAATGDADAVGELKILRTTMLLWSWAGAESARRAVVAAWTTWLKEAALTVGELALEVVEAGVKALAAAGLSELEGKL